MIKVVFMRGLPGSGKSTTAGRLWGADWKNQIFSTDDYWLRPDGTYDFNGALLGKAHAWNLDRFKRAFTETAEPSRLLIVDNTNVRLADMKPYIAFTRTLPYPVEIHYVLGEAPWAWETQACFVNNTHRVPLESIQRMASNWEALPSGAAYTKVEDLING